MLKNNDMVYPNSIIKPSFDEYFTVQKVRREKD